MRDLSRRAFNRLAGLALPAGSVAATPSGTANRTFPNDFLWGAGTSAYQIEGAVKEEGRGPSIWDTFSHYPPLLHGDTGDIADDHFHRFKDDIALMKAIGLKAYRFSVAWPRVFPQGRGAPNPKGLDFYARLLDALHEAGIEPFCTLYHWDLPQPLQDKGGWETPDTAHAFADYAGHVASKFSDRIQTFITLNEIRSFIELGYGDGNHAPGLRVGRARLAQAKHHALLAHGLGVQAVRQGGRAGTRVGIAENVAATVPVYGSPAHIDAARRAMREENAAYITAIMEGAYTERYLADLGRDAPKIATHDMQIIAAPMDFLGINVYQATYVRADPGSKAGYCVVPQPTTFPRMKSKWLTFGPEALYWAPILIRDRWRPNEIYVTENGASAADVRRPDGSILDIDRIAFLRSYLAQLHRAIADGAPVKGYFVWSLLDNFEWDSGYAMRFGLCHVDYATQARSMKLSAHYYKDVIASNAPL